MSDQPTTEDLRALFALSHDPMCIATVSGQFSHVNPAFVAALGYSAEELTSRPFLEFVHPDDVESTVRELEQLGGGRKTIGFHNRYRHADGSYRRLRWTSTPSEDRTKVYAIARDVTDFAALEAELEHSQRILTHAAYLARIGGWEFDAIGKRITWSDEVRRLHETPADYAPTSREEALSFYHEEERALIAAAIENAYRTGTGWDMECRFIGAKGTQKWVRTSGEPVVNASGEVIGLRGALQDITVRKEQEALRREFFSTLSHGLRTPLASMLAALRLVESDSLEVVPDPLVPMIAVASRNAERLARILDELLDLERMNDGRVRVAAVRLFPQAIVRNAVESVASLAEYHGADIEVTITSAQTFVGDERRCVQILSGLLANALRLARRGESVPLKVSLVAGQVEFAVADRGPGVPDAIKRSIFHRYKVHESPQTSGEHMGLGLVVARRLIELQAGRIGVRDRDGGGSEFWFSLPVSQAPTP